jgi:hypothetical protein
MNMILFHITGIAETPEIWTPEIEFQENPPNPKLFSPTLKRGHISVAALAFSARLVYQGCQIFLGTTYQKGGKYTR